MFTQIPLPYAFDALEPHIDALTVETHYGKHHATYTKNFNDLVTKAPALAGKSAEEILSSLDAVPEDVRQGIRNNGGGYLNHNIYFEALSPKGGGVPADTSLKGQIEKDFGSLDNLVDTMSKAGVGQFGSGWAWLVWDGTKLKVITTANQDSPLQLGYQCMLLTLDVWEHAYYLKYKNLRADYIKAYWNVVDWDVVAKRFQAR